MNASVRILAFAGSTRKESFNKKLVRIAAAGAREARAEVTLIDLADYRLPVFDADLEAAEGKPEAAKKLTQLFREHDALLISCPEYNSSITGVLKNTLDWISRPDAEAPGGGSPFAGKVVTLLAASPGALGGLRGLVHVRAILANLGCLVLPGQVAVPRAGEAFREDGSLADEKIEARVEELARTLAETTGRLRS